MRLTSVHYCNIAVMYRCKSMLFGWLAHMLPSLCRLVVSIGRYWLPQKLMLLLAWGLDNPQKYF